MGDLAVKVLLFSGWGVSAQAHAWQERRITGLRWLQAGAQLEVLAAGEPSGAGQR